MQRQRKTDEVEKRERELKESEAKGEEARAKLNERHQKDKSDSDRQRKMLGFQINQQDRDEWISASPFKNQIQQVQTVINRLDSFLIWNGRAKAQAIRDALNRAIDAAIKHEAGSTDKKRFQDFSKFASFSKSGYTGNFPNPSLEDALSIHRFADIDALFEKDEPESHSIISRKS